METEKKSNQSGFTTGGMHAHYTLAVCFLLFVMYFVNWYMFGVVLEPMKMDLGLTDGQAGAIQTGFLLCVAAFSFPISFMVDRWSRRKAITVMAIFWSVFMFITGSGNSFLGVLAPRIMVGIGLAGFSGASAALVSAVYHQKLRGRVMGIFNASIPIGAVIGVMLGGYISANHGGWRVPFYVFAIPGIILSVFAYFMKDYKTIEHTDECGVRMGFFSTAKTLFKIRSLKWVFIGYGLQDVMAFTFVIWAPAFLMRSQGIPEDKAGMTVGIIGVMAIIGAPLGGILSDLWQKKNRRGRMLIPAITIPIGAVMMALAMTFELKGIGLVFGILYGVIAIMGVPALSSVTQDVVSPGLKAASWGMSVFCMYAIFGAWAPAFVGFISDSLGGGAAGLKIAIIAAASGGILAGICYLLGARHYPSDLDKVKDVVFQSEC